MSVPSENRVHGARARLTSNAEDRGGLNSHLRNMWMELLRLPGAHTRTRHLFVILGEGTCGSILVTQLELVALEILLDQLNILRASPVPTRISVADPAPPPPPSRSLDVNPGSYVGAAFDTTSISCVYSLLSSRYFGSLLSLQ